MKKWWEDEPWRMIQTNMREIDMEDINAEAYVKQLQEFGATAALINVGGILANYETAVEDHTVNPHLHGDSLEAVMEECHRAGIRVMARVDYSKIRRPVYEKHPDWAYRTAQGDIVDYNGNVHACICGGFQQEKAFEITREIAARFPIDGIFINMGGFCTSDYSYHYYGPCHCDNCKREFKRRFGLELPDGEDNGDPRWRKYRVFQTEIMREYKSRMEQTVHEQNPQIAVEGVDFVRLESNTEYKKGKPQWQYDSSSTVRGQQSLAGGLPCSNPTVDFIGYFYRHVAVSPAQQAMRMWQTLGNFGMLDYYIMSRLDNHEDRSGYEAVKKVFHFHRQHEKLFAGTKQYAEVLLIRSGGYAKSEEGCGWVRALTESHILLHEAEPNMIAGAEELKQYKAVIAADVTVLSRCCTEALDQYAAEGGCLIIVGESGRIDENGEDCGRIPFKSLGNPIIKRVREDMVSAMFKLRQEEREWFPLLKESELFFFGDKYIFAEYPEAAKKYLQLIPPHPYGPPEVCFYQQTTDLPGFTVCGYGKGRAVHIPWNPGSLFFEEGYENTYAFMNGILTKAAGLTAVEARPFSRMVEVTLGFHSESWALVQLINGTGHFGNSFLEPVPVNQIFLKLPMAGRPVSVTSLTTGENADYDWKDGTLFLTVPKLHEYEALVVRF